MGFESKLPPEKHSALPKAIGHPSVIRDADGRLRTGTAGEEFKLDEMAEAVWQQCDGSRTVAALAEAVRKILDRPVKTQEVFSALDFLADAGLLEQRVAPPAAEVQVSRRSLLARLTPAISAAVSLAFGAPLAQSNEANTKEYNSKESNNKENNRKADARESDSKENNRKADARESDSKENTRKNNESHSKERDYKDKKNATDDANSKESHSKEESNKGIIDRNTPETDTQRAHRETQQFLDKLNEYQRKMAEALMPQAYPHLYKVVGHKLSEFPEAANVWSKWQRIEMIPPTAERPDLIFAAIEKDFWRNFNATSDFKLLLAKSGFLCNSSLTRLGTQIVLGGNAPGFDVSKTQLGLEMVNKSGSFDPDNVRWVFRDLVGAFDFLSNIR